MISPAGMSPNFSHHRKPRLLPDQAQAPATVTGINALVNIAPAVMLIIAMLPILFKYRLDEQTMAKITAELTERRAAAEQA